VSFDVPATVRIKARYVREMGLGGLFYWTGTGDRAGEESLIAVGYEELVCG
jgi:chitinase